MKKIISFLLILTLLLAAIPMTYAEAAVKLTKKNLTLNEGNTYRLRITGTSKTIKWSTDNKNVATVSSRGTVKAVKAGVATITAAVSSKKYKCKVKVNDVLTNEEAAANVTYRDFQVQDRILVLLQNNNKVNAELKVEITFYDSNNAVISVDSDYIWVAEAGKQTVSSFACPYDDNFDSVPFSSYKIKISADVEYVSTDKVIDQISTESNSGVSGLMVTAKNNSDDNIFTATIYVLYYSGEKIIGYDYNYYSDISSGESASKEFSEPHDEDYNKVSYDDYKIIIIEASFE